MSQYDSVPDSRVVMDVGEGQVVQEAGSWSVRRSLSGGGLPGQARAVSGSSVGSGQVQIVSPAGRSPWTPGPVRPGGRVGIEARADTDRPWSSVAQMVAREVSGTASMSRALDVSVEDRLDDLQRSVAVPPYLASGGEVLDPDAAHAVVLMLRAAGIRAFPSMPSDAVVYTTFHGRIETSAGIYSFNPATSPPLAWGTVAGQAGITGGIAVTGGYGNSYMSWAHGTLPKRFFVVISSTGSVAVETPGVDYSTTTLDVAAGGRIDLSSWGLVSGERPTLFVDMDPAWGGRLLCEIEITGGGSTTGTGYRVRAAGSTTGWSAWTAANTDGVVRTWSPTKTGLSVIQYPGSEMCCTALLVGPSLPSDAWDPLAARVGLAHMALAPYVATDPTADLWQSLQSFAAATLGGVWRDEYGAIVYRGRRAIQSGDDCNPSWFDARSRIRDRMGTPAEQVKALDSLEDVPWSVSVDDVADRVEVISREVVDVTSASGALTVWESTATTVVRGGQTVTLIADLSAAAASPAAWLPVWSTVSPAGQQSRWNAFPNADLTGAQPSDSALAVTTTLLSPTQARIAVRNTTGATLYVSQLTVRMGRTWTPTEGRVLSRGVATEAARSPFRHDMGTWVQDDSAASEVLEWLAGTLSEPLPVLRGVRVIPDVDRRLGTICVLTDPVTGIKAKCLISGIDTSHSPGSLEQRLDLTVLYTVEWDWGRWLTTRAEVAGSYAYTEAALAAYLINLLGPSATEADLAAWLPTGVI